MTKSKLYLYTEECCPHCGTADGYYFSTKQALDLYLQDMNFMDEDDFEKFDSLEELLKYCEENNIAVDEY